MANEPGTPAARARRRMRTRGGRSVKKILGMTKRPTTAGQARFGGVDVTGAQMTPKEEQRAGALAGRTPFHDPITGAQMTQDEIERANKKRPIDRYMRGTRR